MKKLLMISAVASLLAASTSFAFERSTPDGSTLMVSRLMPSSGHDRQGDN